MAGREPLRNGEEADGSQHWHGVGFRGVRMRYNIYIYIHTHTLCRVKRCNQTMMTTMHDMVMMMMTMMVMMMARIDSVLPCNTHGNRRADADKLAATQGEYPIRGSYSRVGFWNGLTT